MQFINEYGIEAIQEHCEGLKAYAEEKLSTIPGVRIINPGVGASNLFFEVEGVEGKIVAYHLVQRSVMVRSGAACVKIVNDNYSHDTAIRASFHIYSTKEDVDKLYEGMVDGGDYSQVKIEEIDTKAICA